jgi:hypothetical protein
LWWVVAVCYDLSDGERGEAERREANDAEWINTERRKRCGGRAKERKEQRISDRPNRSGAIPKTHSNPQIIRPLQPPMRNNLITNLLNVLGCCESYRLSAIPLPFHQEQKRRRVEEGGEEGRKRTRGDIRSHRARCILYKHQITIQHPAHQLSSLDRRPRGKDRDVHGLSSRLIILQSRIHGRFVHFC